MLRNTIFIKPEDSTTPLLESEDFSPTSDEDMELPIDLIQTTGHLVARCPIVGAGIHDVEISLSTDSLTITKSGQITDPEKIVQWHHQECHWGNLSRTIDLPKPVDADHTRATLSDGVLVITMPITSGNNTRLIKIKE